MNSLNRKNRMLLLYIVLTNIVIGVGNILEYIFGGVRIIVVIPMLCLVISSSIIELFIYIRDRESTKLKYIALVLFSLAFLLLVLTVEKFWIFFLPFPMLAAFTIYEDKKLIFWSTIACNSINLIGILRHMNVVYREKMPLYNGWISITEIIILIAYSISIYITSDMIKDDNVRELAKVQSQQDKSKHLAEEAINIGNSIKEYANKTQEIIQELDNETDKALNIFEDILEGNSSNLDRVMKQETMTYNIGNMIDKVQSEVNMASNMASKSGREITISQNSIINLKDESGVIVSNNDGLIQAINYFIQSIDKIKKFIEGIEQISEQIDLLALNAAIESERVGDEGKGFAHVTTQIKHLADATALMTRDMNNMIISLDSSAKRARSMVDNVITEVDNENIIVETTHQELKLMEESVQGLELNIKAILDRINSIVIYSEKIKDHTKGLKTLSNEIVQNTNSTVSLNEENKNRMKDSKALMENLIVLTEKMDRFINKSTT